jgi:predicted nucleotidyltransferase component of viral defense system
MAPPVRLIRNEFELQDLVDRLGRDPGLVERDFALVTIAAGLVETFGDGLCFKGGFVLRHVYGHERFSRDIDATRINPPKSKLNAAEVAEAIRRASVRNLLTLNPHQPATDSGRSLDFDDVRYTGPIGSGQVSVEVSYREDIIDGPDLVPIGEPYYEPFEIPVMRLNEIVAEKLRTLAQRRRPTDLSDLAMVLIGHTVDDTRVRALAERKFELVKDTDNRGRIERNIESMRAEYDAAVTAVAPDAPDYRHAVAVVLARLPRLLA